ncbi:flagellar basal body P-ring formation chaperone FlgA [Propionivibrio sp.]|uniref:flagellar basal body P-ring formation chaperone FlgA n=1 Tax=Propionivibrio sp. TaxID=2212460 RepID=UPI0025EDCB06|nr:flagellar basal body P-ring formation chaperone FlgA [Propionivibrio sp.]MBK7355528.1 flagellar basal body P-ring formation protein FlgA [Propionivibrio sp.]MBK8400803.1 flagellar basal body P-ring formation protein FlgA [Propionivibrio sp.]MBK8744829.1 flagellar basal body P-ring formation protein FlgA [Propionivibrio sp.]MBK8893191.1 flagellar basal body P-ring formation protein FlgA [Propionivibrio sp.]MBL0207833.1 flagellar basal body P-ring formation protein FlgA [Propionivibrio sp.]
MKTHFILDLLVIFCGIVWLPPMATAQSFAQTPLYNSLDDYLRTQTKGLPGKVTYRIGSLDERAQLSPCEVFEPFLPAGGKLWGKSTVGVRCLGPSTWTIYVPVQVNVSGNYLISARTMPAGYVLGTADIVVRNGDLSTLPANIVTDKTQAIGKVVKNGFSAGQPLRGDLLIDPWVVQQGQTVKTVSNGPGFSVSSEGKALNNATAGQLVQVRTASGQTVSGIARPGGIVEVSH